MSNVGQGVGAVIGGIIGFAIGGPVGALYGLQIGTGVASIFFPTQLPRQMGPRLEDLQTTSAKVGEPVIIPYGTVAVPGTVIFLACTSETATTEEIGGKGAPTQEQTTYQYFQTIALGLCEGPIAGVSRIWENGELKYDTRPQQDDESDADYQRRIEATDEYSQTFVLHTGEEDQAVDPTIEALLGTENTPAWRGLAYIVYPNRELLDTQGHRHPQFRFELGNTPVVVEDGRDYVLGVSLVNNTMSVHRVTGIALEYMGGYEMDWSNGIAVRGPDSDETGSMVGYVLAFDASGSPDPPKFYTATVTDNQEDPATVLFAEGASIDLADIGITSGSYFIYGAIRDRTDDMVIFQITNGGTEYMVKVNPETGEVIWVNTGIDPVIYDHSHSQSRPGSGKYCVISQIGPDQCVVRINTADGSYTTHVLAGFDFVNGEQIYDAESDRIIVFNGSLGVAVVSTTGLTFTGWTELGAPLNHANRELLAVDWERDRYFVVDVSGDDDHTGIRAFRISDNTEYARATVAEMGLDITFLLDSLQITDDGNLMTTSLYLGHPNGLRVARIGGATLEVINTYSEPGSSAANGRVLQNGVALRGVVSTLGASTDPVSLATIVSDVCERCGLDPDDDINVEDLEDRYVIGYALTRVMSGRDAIDPLRQVGYFDGVESQGILKFPARGAPIVATLDEQDLGAHLAGGEAPPLVTTKKMQDVELPRQVRVKHISQAREYEPGEQLSPMRYVTEAVNELPLDVPVVITGQHAAQAAEIMWADAWTGRWTHEISLDGSFLRLDPTDCIGVPIDGRIYRCRIETIDDTLGELRGLSLRRDDDGSYVSYADADPPPLPPSAIVIYGPVTLILLDIPLLREEDDDAGIYAVAYRSDPSDSFSGAVIQRSVDSGTSWANVGTIANEAPVGELTAYLPEGPSTIWDNENEILVSMRTGTLESRTEEAVLNGANTAAVGADGRWEIVQFLNAELIGENSYRLTGLLRGRRGTEQHIGTSFSGDDFVMLSAGGVVRIPLPSTEIGQTRLYRGVAGGTNVASAEEIEFTASGEALETFSPVQITGEWQENGDLVITWERRSRLGQELPEGADVPLGEEAEEYEVDILDQLDSPSAVLRTLTVSDATTVTYTAAQINADGYGPHSPIPVRVYQLSAIVGRGAPGEAIV